MTSYDTLAMRCPKCAKLLEAATSVAHRSAPKAGDLTVCFYCASLLQFTKALGVVRLSKVPADADDNTRRTVEKTRNAILRIRGLTD